MINGCSVRSSTSMTVTPEKGLIVQYWYTVWFETVPEMIGGSFTATTVRMVWLSLTGSMTKPSRTLMVNVVISLVGTIMRFSMGLYTNPRTAVVTTGGVPVME